ncbi:uncharacterized protein BCR38DRAFT_153595 [Pseudomassariella vexata]|uniref:Uncharacterized protein n=1 Tax=Pseudomassariella vexata TaxID=1141098 RepID=A0A1Y2E7F2_9PEZI|nr:uncharacterized protein BCR38DRAFT_153595 [Pseudomassariella vexata]ORY67254.1 hypothetical protein BCR38DRAFT_153595 [Pseudomassariella vexata]
MRFHGATISTNAAPEQTIRNQPLMMGSPLHYDEAPKSNGRQVVWMCCTTHSGARKGVSSFPLIGSFDWLPSLALAGQPLHSQSRPRLLVRKYRALHCDQLLRVAVEDAVSQQYMARERGHYWEDQYYKAVEQLCLIVTTMPKNAECYALLVDAMEKDFRSCKAGVESGSAQWRLISQAKALVPNGSSNLVSAKRQDAMVGRQHCDL